MTAFDPRSAEEIFADFINGPQTEAARAVSILAYETSGPEYVKRMFAYTCALKPTEEEGRPVFYGLQWGKSEFQGDKTAAAFNRLAGQADQGFQTKEIVMLVHDHNRNKPPIEVPLVLMAPPDARIFDVPAFPIYQPFDADQSPCFTDSSAQIWVPFSPSSREEKNQPALLLHRPTSEGAAHAQIFLDIAIKNRSRFSHA